MPMECNLIASRLTYLNSFFKECSWKRGEWVGLGLGWNGVEWNGTD